MGPGHPEAPERLRAILRGLEQARFAPLSRMNAPQAQAEALQRVHPPSYLAALERAAPREGY
ncbi:MAG: histone deacetylase family protein, partial [Methylocystis sp.]